jgi:hypothetical protein
MAILHSYGKCPRRERPAIHTGSISRSIPPKKQFVDSIDLVIGNATENIGQPSLRMSSTGVVTLSAISLISAIEQQAKSLKSRASAFAVAGQFRSI